MYSAFDKSAIQIAEVFCNTAEILWEKERNNDSYLTMASSVILSLSLIGHGKDHAVHFYAQEALSMGKRLGLYDDQNLQNKNMKQKMSQDDMTARCHAAWGIFNWSV